MHGRLSPSRDGRFQYFPKDDWREEFPQARNLGFSSIEWIVEVENFEANPLFNPEGRKEIQTQSKQHGVGVYSLCADYFMKKFLIGESGDEAAGVLRTMVSCASEAGVSLIGIPLLEGAAPKTEDEKNECVVRLSPIVKEAQHKGISFVFETEMTAEESIDFLERFSEEAKEDVSNAVGICYDIGNATSYGFDSAGDIKKLGKRIHEVHLKDRKKGTTQTVVLGTGDADFQGSFRALADIGFGGVIIMQAWRGEDYIEDAAVQLAYIKKIADTV